MGVDFTKALVEFRCDDFYESMTYILGYYCARSRRFRLWACDNRKLDRAWALHGLLGQMT